MGHVRILRARLRNTRERNRSFLFERSSACCFCASKSIFILFFILSLLFYFFSFLFLFFFHHTSFSSINILYHCFNFLFMFSQLFYFIITFTSPRRRKKSTNKYRQNSFLTWNYFKIIYSIVAEFCYDYATHSWN